MTSLGTLELDFQAWGASWGGTDLSERTAMLAEQGYVPTVPMWDRTADDLAGSLIAHGDEPYRRVPDWWALPWVAEREPSE